MRLCKKFCKLLVANLVDLFPAKKDLLIDMIREVCNLSRLRTRLMRYAFTSIGMMLLKNLLAQQHSLEVLRSQFKSQPSVIQSQMDTLDSAQEYVSDKLVSSLARELVKARMTDSCPLVRKCLLEHIQTFELNELRQACQQKEMKLVQHLF